MTIPHGTEKSIGASPLQKARISSASSQRLWHVVLCHDPDFHAWLDWRTTTVPRCQALLRCNSNRMIIAPKERIWRIPNLTFIGVLPCYNVKTHPRFVMKTNHWYGPYIRLISHTEDRWKIRTIHSMPAMIKTWFCWIMVIHPMPWESKHNGLYINIG